MIFFEMYKLPVYPIAYFAKLHNGLSNLIGVFYQLIRRITVVQIEGLFWLHLPTFPTKTNVKTNGRQC